MSTPLTAASSQLVDQAATLLANAAHRTLAQMETQGYIARVITQNIDMLHSRAGSKTIYEFHGHMRKATPVDSLAEVVIRDDATSVLPNIMRRLEAMQ